jgi:uncharacterized protein (DUF488 family)
MPLHQLLTIGHSNRTIEEFITLLRQNHVAAVADVRSQPFSRRYPQFNAEPLKLETRNAGIEYVFLGDQLGARRSEPECYDEGQAKYELIARTEAFQKGLDRIRRGLRSRCIALMCAEKDPLTCHRMILVCRHLKGECNIFHVLDSDKVELHIQAELRLLELVGLPSRDLFQTTDELLTQAYEIQGGKIAFRAVPHAATKTGQEE